MSQSNVDRLAKMPTISGSLKELPQVFLRLVSGSALESFWNLLVQTYHYLGCKKLLGRRLKYMAFIDETPVAALSWSAPARKLKVRDGFIGWPSDTREQSLQFLAANSRFVIFPWVQVPHLGSHLLGRNLRRIRRDWQERFQQDLLLVETFVDPSKFQGTVYKASNWCYLGNTKGYTKLGKGYMYHGCVKKVFVYVLEPRFKDVLGIPSTPDEKKKLPKKVEELKMIMHNRAWEPHPMTQWNLAEQDLSQLKDEVAKYHNEFNDCFGRIEHEYLGCIYLFGLLSKIKNKTSEAIALEVADKKTVRSVQRFMRTCKWDHEKMFSQHQYRIAQALGSQRGMITVDPSEFPKKGKKSVGVASQYCGRHGKTENCQSGVFVGYTSENGFALTDAQLFMPKKWFENDHEELRIETLVPEDLEYQTKQEIALDLIKKAYNVFPARWIGCDSAFGSSENFLKNLPEDLYYFADIKSTERIFLTKPEVGIPPYKGKGKKPTKPKVLSEHKPCEVSDLLDSDEVTWTPVNLGEGAKGPQLAQIARLRVYPSRDGLPWEDSVWLVIRKRSDGELRYAYSNAPETISLQELCEASCMRWPIEQCFGEGKGHLGMDHYEHRSWTAWHRHMVYVMLAQHFVARTRQLIQKKTPKMTFPQIKRLIEAVIPLRSFTLEGAFEIAKYYLKKNYEAYLSHRKKRLKEAEELGVVV